MSITPLGAARSGARVPPPDPDAASRGRHEVALDAQRRAALAVAGDGEPAGAFAAVARETAALAGARRAGIVRFSGGDAVPVASAAPGAPDPPLPGALPRVPLAAAGVVGSLERDGLAHRSREPLPGTPEPPWAPGPGERAMALPVRVAGGLWGALWCVLPAGAPEPHEGIRAMCDLAALVAGRIDRAARAAGETLEAAFRGDMDGRRSLALLLEAARGALGAVRVTLHLEPGDPSSREDLISVCDDGVPSADAPEVAVRLRDELAHWRRLLGGAAPWAEVGDLRADPRAAASLLATTEGRGAVVRRVERPGGGDAPQLGLLVVLWEQPHAAGDRDRMVIESLAGLAGIALAGAVIPAGPAATVAAGRDPLTGLLTHRAFQERLAAEAGRALSTGAALSLAFVDIDRFRRVNETHGHAAGDRVLADVAGRLLSEAGPHDVLGRVGGEEIAWISPRPGVELLNAVDRAREAIASGEMGGVESVTVSAGLCDLAQAGSRDDLERFAEGALYWAKQHGRDVALAYTPEVVEVLSADERAEHLGRSQALQSIRVLARAVDAKDPSTLRHSERVADLAVALGTALGWGTERLVALREAGLVHDVGKIGVPDAILFKPSRLTDGEYREIMRHATIGAEILTDVLSVEQVAWVRGHHERWDGAGYPDGLAGEVIPPGARVLALADAWDVMTSRRPYHEPLDRDAAMAECLRCAGEQFAPEVVEAMERLVAVGAVPVPGT